MKDIHDFNGVHGDWLKHAAVTLVVHHHHEQITAGDLLNHKGPANHSTDSQIEKKKKERWKRKREQETVESEIWLAVKEHGYDVNFHVCHRICVMSLHILPWQRGEGLCRDSTGCMSRV